MAIRIKIATIDLCDDRKEGQNQGMQKIGRPKRSVNTRHFLAEWRAYRGLSQVELADRIASITGNESFDNSRLSKFERGIEGIREDMLYAIADALNIPTGWLFVRPDVAMGERKKLEVVGNATEEEIGAVLAFIRARKAS